ncbi:DUF732 domain-containing protein [Micromonospora sp. NPDC023633]|uniref:DUF732 domain-containing protein n=1 Tax=Micromonospora sp. NPDC023633 TaxID=3154320 RepID=UPI0033E7341C
MRARHIWVAAALVGALAGCGGSDDTAEPAAQTTTASTGEAAFLAALKVIDPQLAERKSAVDDAENICLDLKQGKDEVTVAKNAAARFEVDNAKAAMIVGAAKGSLCPSAG